MNKLSNSNFPAPQLRRARRRVRRPVLRRRDWSGPDHPHHPSPRTGRALPALPHLRHTHLRQVRNPALSIVSSTFCFVY